MFRYWYRCLRCLDWNRSELIDLVGQETTWTWNWITQETFARMVPTGCTIWIVLLQSRRMLWRSCCIGPHEERSEKTLEVDQRDQNGSDMEVAKYGKRFVVDTFRRFFGSMKPMNVTWVGSFGIIWSLIQLKIEHRAFIVLQNGLKHELLIETEQRATAVVKFTLQKLFVKTPEFRDQSTGINIFAYGCQSGAGLYSDRCSALSNEAGMLWHHGWFCSGVRTPP